MLNELFGVKDILGGVSIVGLLSLLIKLNSKTQTDIASKVSIRDCEERRGHSNTALRSVIDKIDRFKDEQSKEHQEISEKLGKIWGKMNGGN